MNRTHAYRSRDSSGHVTQLAEDLLLLAQSDKGTLPVRRSDVPASALAERVAARFVRRAADAGRGIEIRVPDDLTLAVDPMRMEQALGKPGRERAAPRRRHDRTRDRAE